ALLRAGMTTGGLLLAAVLVSFGLNYGTTGAGFPEPVAEALKSDRQALLMSDAFRSFLFAGLAFGALWVYLRKNLSPMLAIVPIGVLILADVGGISKRFISEEDWLEPKQTEQFIAPTEVDLQIMKDPDLDYRVADFRRGAPWNNAFTGYHHKSVGGYHAAKLMRYQEIIEKYLGDPNANAHLYGMLNAKYFIFKNGDQEQAAPNEQALGNAWFVRSYEILPNADAEFLALKDLRPGEKAIFDQKYAQGLEGFDLRFDSTATIRLTSYHPDRMVYESNANAEQLAVFSEIYYPEEKGWKLLVDGERTPILKANYLLRAARIPAGKHEIQMIFEPKSFYTGETITLIGSWLVVAFFAAGLFFYFKNHSPADPFNLPAKAPAPKTPKPAAKTSRSRKKKG
ncbi:MAG: hypothetical protein D6714_04565, partial [Bacteroidetes bacterium]